MSRKLVLSSLLAVCGVFAGQAALAGHDFSRPGKNYGHHNSRHHFIPPGHRKHGYRVKHFSYGRRYYAPPVRIVRHSRVIYGHRHHSRCGHQGYRPSYYSRYDSYYNRHPRYRRAQWRDDRFGFFIYYDY